MKLSQRGFGLVELMISVTLGLFLSTAVIQVFLATNSSSKVQDSLAQIQENARFAMRFIGKEIRMAGYMGCSSIGNINVNVIAVPANTVDFSLATALVGEDDVAAGNALGAIVGSDILHIKKASENDINVTGNMNTVNANLQIENNSLGFVTGDYVMVSDCLNADVFRIVNNPGNNGNGNAATTLTHSNGQGLNSSNNLSKLYQTDAEVFSFESVDYFVRDTGRDTAGGRPINALYMRRLIAGSGGAISAATELVEGVENMQLTYGVDTNGDRAVDEYQSGAAVADWTDVLSVRISLQMVASEENIVGKTGSESAQSIIDVNGNVVANTDGRFRQIFTNVFAIRNKLP
ncbi:PilW family protein [Zhongshania sp. BJYM1]|uniref:PilW family protein n=1 Tax=Zhongshania aquatica TaxID=2965069 RepID=UPI0022B56E59|nr:PilW family protein [Marortus sp. BJYM1]